MTRHAAWVALAAFGVAVGGCGPAKELPDDLPPVQDGGEKAVAVPAASEPAAKEYVDKALKAFTAGKPELLARGKFSRSALKGIMTLPVDNQSVPLPAARDIVAAWPDRFFAGNKVDYRGQNMHIRTWLRGGQLTTYEGDGERDRGNRAELAGNLRADAVAQHWMATFLPLAEPKAVVFDLRSADVSPPGGGAPQAVRSLKLALPEYPLYQLVFDAKTDLLVRVEYATTEQGAKLRKQWSVLEHKAGPDGQLLPARTECRHNGALVEQWEAEKWEFPAAIDDGEFSPPKK